MSRASLLVAKLVPPRSVAVGGWDGTGWRACFAVVAGVAGVLAAGLIRGDLQAHLAVARLAEQPPSSTPTSLLVRTTSVSLAVVGAGGR